VCNKKLKPEINKKIEGQILGFDQGGLQGGCILKFNFTGIDIVIIGGIEKVNH